MKRAKSNRQLVDMAEYKTSANNPTSWGKPK